MTDQTSRTAQAAQAVPPARTSSAPQRTRLDVASAALLVVGLLSAVLAIFLVVAHDQNFVIIWPSVLAVVVGAKNITKREAVFE